MQKFIEDLTTAVGATIVFLSCLIVFVAADVVIITAAYRFLTQQ